MMFQPDAISARVRRLRVIWAALLLSVSTLTAVVWFVLRSGGFAETPALDRSMLMGLGVTVALALLLAPLVRRRIDTPRRGADADEIARRWETGWIVGQAIKEAVGIAGLVIGLLAGSLTWALALSVASLVSMIMTPPWEHELRVRIQRGTGSAATSL